MKKKIISFLLALTVSMHSLCFTVNAETSTDNSDSIRTIAIDFSDDNATEIELYEGEAVQLDFQLDPEIYDLEDIRSYEENRKPIVSYDGKLIGCNSGKYDIDVFVRNTYTYDSIKFKLVVIVLTNENISPENRAKLDRINNFGLHDYRRRKMELLGAMDENAPRLTLDKIQEFIDNSEDFYEIIRQVNKYVDYPDDVSGSGMIKHYYWSDPKGNVSISISSDNEYIGYVKTADDGTVIGSQMLYPEKTEFEEDGKSKNSPYIEYNQIESGLDRVIQLEYDKSAEPVEIEVYEGEQIQLDFQLDSELYDIKDVRYYSRGKCAIVSPNGKFVSCKSGEDKVTIGVTDKTTGDQLIYTLLVNVLPNDSISDKNRNELNRLNDFEYDDYRRRKMELLGVADENAPRLTFEKIQEFIDNSENYIDIIKKVNNYIEYPDHVQSKGHESYSYWSDSKGNEVISIGYDSDYICYGKIADDGTFIGAQMLYPVKEEFYEDGKTKCQEYIEYNQIKPKLEGYGTLNLKFIDESTDEPFTETNGTFQLIYNNDKGDTEIVKSWDCSEGSEITISDVSRDYTYELRYIDNYHGEFPEEYKYEISPDKGTRYFSFADDSELSCNVYLKKHRLGEPYLLGDVNSDKMFNVADVVTLQKWLLGKPNTVLMNWKAADLCTDGRLDVFDLCLMKNKLVKDSFD